MCSDSTLYNIPNTINYDKEIITHRGIRPLATGMHTMKIVMGVLGIVVVLERAGTRGHSAMP